MKILLTGPHGGANLGDEFILHCIVRQCHDRGAKVTAMSMNPQETERQHAIPAILSVNLKWIRLSPLKLLREFDVVVVAGGEQIQEGRFHNPIWSLLANVWITTIVAKKSGCKVVLYAVGAERLKTRIAKRMLKTILKYSDVIAVRDEASHAYLASQTRRDIKLVADPVFTVAPRDHKKASKALRRNLDISSGPIVVLCPARGRRHSLQYVTPMVRAAIRATSEVGGTLLVQAMEHRPVYDPSVIQMPVFDNPIIRRLPLNPFNAEELIDLFAGADLVVSARMHPLILASTQGTPWIAIERNSKLSNFCKTMGVPGFPSESLDESQLLEQMKAQLEADRSAWSSAQVNRVDTLRERAALTPKLLHESTEAGPEQ